MCKTIFYIQQILFSQYQLPAALAGGKKIGWFLMALAKTVGCFWLKPIVHKFHFSPDEAGGNGKL